ncbi:MAG: hypothetical protein CMF69_08930 [Magnetovibrio sp.]|nr:hypothetical protein [Magnetovibrio sp.]
MSCAISQFYTTLLLALDRGDKPAVVTREEVFTYAQLRHTTGNIHSHLKRLSGQIVVTYTGKTLESYAAVLAALLSNVTWVPLSAAQPLHRNRHIVSSIKPALLLYDSTISSDLLEFVKRKDIQATHILETTVGGGELTLPRFEPDDVAYIMFTSGSSGQPKGVPMTHANYIPFIRNMLQLLPFGDNEVFSDFHDWAFDISIFYLLCFPFVGGAIAPADDKADRLIPLDYIDTLGITVWSSVPSAIGLIQRLRPSEEVDNKIRIMFLCGEPLPLSIVKYCFTNMNVPAVYNFYGLTETGVENFYHECSPDDFDRFVNRGYAPIGIPLPGNKAKIDKNDELCLAGEQLMRGYLEGAKSSRFFVEGGIRWFRTGDRAEQQGSLFWCRGRLDTQVKIRGYRVDLKDIEVNICQHAHIDEAVCFIDEDKQQRIIAAVVSKEEDIDANMILASIKDRLPDYMRPDQIIVSKKSLPRNENGKLDRNAVIENWRK